MALDRVGLRFLEQTMSTSFAPSPSVSPVLYYSPGACSLAVRIALEEIGQPYESVLCSASNSEGTGAPAYLALNPKGRVPALTGVSGRAAGAEGLLTEAPAILFHLARAHPEAGLLPGGLDAQSRCLEWFNWLSGELHGFAYGQLWRPARFTDVPEQEDAVRAHGRRAIEAFHPRLEAILADGREWAVPEGYSVVDPFLLVFWLWGRMSGFDVTQSTPAWAALMSKVMARPATRRAMEIEGLMPKKAG